MRNHNIIVSNHNLKTKEKNISFRIIIVNYHYHPHLHHYNFYISLNHIKNHKNSKVLVVSKCMLGASSNHAHRWHLMEGACMEVLCCTCTLGLFVPRCALDNVVSYIVMLMKHNSKDLIYCIITTRRR